MHDMPGPIFSPPWIVLLLGAAALFIAMTQPQAQQTDGLPGAALCLTSQSATR